MNIGASDFVLDTIRNGYVIPFVNPPVSMYFKNNKSALDNSELVDQAVSDLVDSGCVHEVFQEKPRYVCCCGQISK
jgi:DICT domain-containing protein